MIGKLLGSAAIAMLAAMAVSGCASTPENCSIDNTGQGALLGAGVGAAVGGVAGAIFGGDAKGVAIGAGSGAVVGALAGTAIGSQQDRACRQYALNQAMDRAASRSQAQPRETASAPSRPVQQKYEAVSWSNRATNQGGTIEPMGAVTTGAGGQECMAYKDTRAGGGTSGGRACRGPNGQWS